MKLIGLDVGTTGTKAIVFNETGMQLGYGFREYSIQSDSTGRAEQDAESVWEQSKAVLGEALKPVGPRDVTALSLSVQGDAVIPVDGEFKSIGPAILGMDYRSRPYSEQAAVILGDRRLFELTGMRPHPMNSLTKIMLIKDRSPELYSRAFKISTYADFILAKLGAPGFIDYTMASRTMAFDLIKREWSSEILDTLEIDADKFSEAVPSGTVVGKLAADLAEELGLEERPFLVTGGHDQTCAAVGGGVIDRGRAVVSTGTAEVFSTAFGETKTNDAMYSSYYPCYIHAVPDCYFTFSLNHVGGLLFRWFRDTFCDVDAEAARSQGLDTYAYLVRRMPPEPSRVLFLPHLNGSGTPWCDMDSKGAVVGITLGTSKYDIVRSILECQTYELALNVEAMARAGIESDEIVAVGGGARSPEWLQMKADILERPVSTLECREAACLGAAIIAGIGAGVYDSFDEAVSEAVRASVRYEPEPRRTSIYRELLALYRELYPALKSVHARL
ncbi:MAG: hypothetical protein JSV33_04675 [bacterium]|nr:MAG: hypothetical protein JSV33_04675 [bacterium]